MKNLIVRWFKKAGWHFTGMLPKKLAKVLYVAAPCHYTLQEFLISIAILKITKVPAKIMLDERAVRPWKRRLLNLFKEIQFMDYSALDDWNKVAQGFQTEERKALVICPLKPAQSHPEYTTEVWYRMCKDQHLPISMIALDEKRKVLRFHGYFFAGKNAQRDLNFIHAYFKPFFESSEIR